MPLLRIGTGCALPLLICALLCAGCSTTSQQASVSVREPRPQIPPAQSRVRDVLNGRPLKPARLQSSEITAVHHEEPDDNESFAPSADDEPFAGASELVLPKLVSEVQRRNPTLQASIAAWAIASERYPQAVALDDPLLQSMFAPGSFASNSSTQASYFIGVAQKVPWAGKRSLRGEIASAQTNAAAFDSRDVALRLAETTRLAYFDYYLVRRDLELNAASREALSQFRETAKAKFEASQVTQQDVLQADVELALLKSRRIELVQNHKIAVARINTLLHREPQLPLPPPPRQLAVDGELPDVDSLRQAALEQRPDLQAQASRIQAEQASVALACKEFYPDMEWMGRYDQFWTDVVQRAQVGLYINLPINQSRRQAAVHEAMARLCKMQHEYDAQIDSVRNDVEAAFARLEASQRTARLFEETILPKAEDNVASAQSGYEAGRVDFLRLVEAERQLIELREKHQLAVAEYHRRLAEMGRVVGSDEQASRNNGQ